VLHRESEILLGLAFFLFLFTLTDFACWSDTRVCECMRREWKERDAAFRESSLVFSAVYFYRVSSCDGLFERCIYAFWKIRLSKACLLGIIKECTALKLSWQPAFLSPCPRRHLTVHASPRIDILFLAHQRPTRSEDSSAAPIFERCKVDEAIKQPPTQQAPKAPRS
jgi:hypothetical protein